MSAKAIGVLLGLGAAVCFELSYLLLAGQARAVSPAGRPGASFLARLARRPWWLLAIGCNGVGFALELAALRHVSLVVVQPLLPPPLVGLVLGARIFLGEQLDARRLAGVALIAVGVTLVVAGAPASTGAAQLPLGPGSVLAVLALALALFSPQLADPGSAWRLVLAAGAGDTLVALATNAVAAAWTRHPVAAVGGVGAVALCGLTALSSESAALQRLPASRVAPTVSGVQVTLPVLLVGLLGDQRWSTATGGGALLAGGVLAVAAGIWCMGVTHRARQPQPVNGVDKARGSDRDTASAR